MRSASRTASLPAGWRLVGYATVGFLVMSVGLLAVYGTEEAGIRVVVRATARTSFACFLAAFLASAARRAWPGAATAWLLANRRDLGLAFAASHGLHLIAIFALYHWSARELVAKTSVAVTVLGGLGYVILAAMAATSFDRSAAWLGRRRWELLHGAGMYYLWFIFAVSYVPRALRAPGYAPLALLAIGALAFRLRHRPGRVRRTAAAMPQPPRSALAD